MTIASRFIVDAMTDGASLEQAIDLARRLIGRAKGSGERVTLANLRGGAWVSSPFDWVPTMRTMRAAMILTASVNAIKVT